METFHLISSLDCCTVSETVWTAWGAGLQGMQWEGALVERPVDVHGQTPHPLLALHGGRLLLVGTRAALLWASLVSSGMKAVKCLCGV